MQYDVVYEVKLRVHARVCAGSQEEAMDADIDMFVSGEPDGGLFVDTSMASVEIVDVEPVSADAVREPADPDTEDEVAPSPVPW